METEFFSPANVVQLAKSLPRGTDVAALQRRWPAARSVGRYESLIAWDAASELAECNREFVSWALSQTAPPRPTDPQHADPWGTTAPSPIARLRMPADFLAVETVAPPETTVVAGEYRYNNTVPVYQRVATRPYDRSNDGTRGRELAQDAVSRGDMQLILDAVNLPERADRFWGYVPDDTALDNTNWRSVASATHDSS